jgi:hypothetical protein
MKEQVVVEPGEFDCSNVPHLMSLITTLQLPIQLECLKRLIERLQKECHESQLILYLLTLTLARLASMHLQLRFSSQLTQVKTKTASHYN